MTAIINSAILAFNHSMFYTKNVMFCRSILKLPPIASIDLFSLSVVSFQSPDEGIFPVAVSTPSVSVALK